MKTRDLMKRFVLIGLTIGLSACATRDPTVFLKIETIAAEHLKPCPLKFEGRSTEHVVAAYQRKSDCDDTDKASARAELSVLMTVESDDQLPD